MPRSSLSFNELAKRTALRSGYLEYEVKDVLTKMVSVIREEIEDGQVVTIDGLGKFYLTKMKGKTVVSGALKQTFKSPPTWKLKFSQSPSYIETLNNRDKYGPK